MADSIEGHQVEKGKKIAQISFNIVGNLMPQFAYGIINDYVDFQNSFIAISSIMFFPLFGVISFTVFVIYLLKFKKEKEKLEAEL